MKKQAILLLPIILAALLLLPGLSAAMAGAETLAKASKKPDTCSSIQKHKDTGLPILYITAHSDEGLDKIVVMESGKPVFEKNVPKNAGHRYSFGYPLSMPGVYSAKAYDNAGRMSLPTSEITVLDTDGDGLTDGYEEALGLDPNKTDSDGDGIGDGTAYLVGASGDGRMPAAVGLLLGAPGTAAGQGLNKALYVSGLVTDVKNLRSGDDAKAPPLNASAVIVQLDPETGAGWALCGSRLTHFTPSDGAYTADRVFSLQGSFGVLKMVLLSNTGGDIMLLAHWNEALQKTEGPLLLLDTAAGKSAALAGSEGSSSFDLSIDGARAAFCAGGKTHVLNLAAAKEDILLQDAPVLMFIRDGRLALGMQDDMVLFAGEQGGAAAREYTGFVDTLQRTNTARSIAVAGGAAAVFSGVLTFSDDGKAIMFISGSGTAQVAAAQVYPQQ